MILPPWVFEVRRFARVTHESTLTCEALKFSSGLRSCEGRYAYLAKCKILNKLDGLLAFCKFLAFQVCFLLNSCPEFFYPHHSIIHPFVELAHHMHDFALRTFQGIVVLTKFVEEC